MTDDGVARIPHVVWEGRYPLHEEWASGTIDGRDYRVLRSLTGPHVLIEFADRAHPIGYSLSGLVTQAHELTRNAPDTVQDADDADDE